MTRLYVKPLTHVPFRLHVLLRPRTIYCCYYYLFVIISYCYYNLFAGIVILYLVDIQRITWTHDRTIMCRSCFIILKLAIQAAMRVSEVMCTSKKVHETISRFIGTRTLVQGSSSNTEVLFG